MIVTKEDRQKMLLNFIIDYRSTEELLAFNAGMDAMMSFVDKKLKEENELNNPS
jgi:hypothetical protein